MPWRLGKSEPDHSLDVEIWHCDPLVIVMNGIVVAYAAVTDVEFTPTHSQEIFGHAVTVAPDAEGFKPEITVTGRTRISTVGYITMGLAHRMGLILEGTDQFDGPVTWYINSAADQFLKRPDREEIEYDEETAKLLEEELGSEILKTDLRSLS